MGVLVCFSVLPSSLRRDISPFRSASRSQEKAIMFPDITQKQSRVQPVKHKRTLRSSWVTLMKQRPFKIYEFCKLRLQCRVITRRFKMVASPLRKLSVLADDDASEIPPVIKRKELGARYRFYTCSEVLLDPVT